MAWTDSWTDSAAAADVDALRYRASIPAKAYEEAGIGPQDVDVAEVHDCFSVMGAIGVEVLGKTLGVVGLGRIGKEELAITNIGIALDSVSFRPLIGFALGTSTLVGQALGRNRPDEAVDAADATSTARNATTSVRICLMPASVMGWPSTGKPQS